MTSAVLAGHPGVVGYGPSLTHPRVRSLRTSPPSSADLAITADGIRQGRAGHPGDVGYGPSLTHHGVAASREATIFNRSELATAP